MSRMTVNGTWVTIRWIGFLVSFLIWPGEGLQAASPLEGDPLAVILKQCQLAKITGQFSSTGAKYQTAGQCLKYPTTLVMTGQGAYSATDGRAQEVVELKGFPPYEGRLVIHVTCLGDPWVDFKRGGLVTPDCRDVKIQAQGEPSVVQPVLNVLMGEVKRTSKPLTALYRDYVPYHFPELRAQHDAALQAEAQAKAAAEAQAQAELNARNSRLSKGVQKQPLIVPTIVLPAASAPPFLANTTVPIKIDPPQGIAATAYMVRLESKNAQGIWASVTTLPVSAAEASRPSGYLGWGAPGNGRGAAMIAGPGTYRLSAQVSFPSTTAWSNWVEFTVISTSKAIQKGPKVFGP